MYETEEGFRCQSAYGARSIAYEGWTLLMSSLREAERQGQLPSAVDVHAHTFFR